MCQNVLDDSLEHFEKVLEFNSASIAASEGYCYYQSTHSCVPTTNGSSTQTESFSTCDSHEATITMHPLPILIPIYSVAYNKAELYYYLVAPNHMSGDLSSRFSLH